MNAQLASEIASKIATAVYYKKSNRIDIIENIMKQYPDVKYEFVGERAHGSGSVGFAKSVPNGRYRINYRCGYSRYNYAPCIEIY